MTVPNKQDKELARIIKRGLKRRLERIEKLDRIAKLERIAKRENVYEGSAYPGEMNPWVYQPKIMDFAKEFILRFENYSEESFAEEYEDEERARKLFQRYKALSDVAYSFMGVRGYERPAPSDEEILLQLAGQRRFREDLEKLDATRKEEFIENNA